MTLELVVLAVVTAAAADCKFCLGDHERLAICPERSYCIEAQEYSHCFLPMPWNLDPDSIASGVA